MNVLRSLQALVTAWPPLVLFVAGLLATAFTILMLVFYVNVSEKLPNMYEEQGWESFIGRLKDEQYCAVISNMTNVTNAVFPENTTSTLESVVLQVRTNLSSSLSHYLRSQPIGHTSAFIGNIVLTGWKPSCGSTPVDFFNNVFVSLLLPAIPSYNVSSQVLSCLTITGHHSIFSEGKVESNRQHCPYGQSSAATIGQLFTSGTTKSLNKILPAKYCDKGESIQFFFDLDIPKTIKFLTVDERFVISSHLLHGLYLLLAFILMLLVYGVVQGRKILRSEHHILVDKEPSMS